MADQAGTWRSERSRSFGEVATDYDRFRPGPDPAVLDWLLPDDARLVVDLGAGTGALTRLLVDRVPDVVAVEPDERMRAVLAVRVPHARVLAGSGESIPLEDGVADAVLASSSWHWMEPERAVPEVARVLRGGGRLGVLWAGPDWTTGWFERLQPRRIMAELGALGLADGEEAFVARRRMHVRRLDLQQDTAGAFGEPERAEVTWTLTMTADDLVGLLGTYSSIIVAAPQERVAISQFARAYLERELGLAGSSTAEVPYRAVCWRATRLAP